MIQDIAPHRFDIAFKTRPPADSDLMFVFRGNRDVLFVATDDGFALPTFAVAGEAVPGAAQTAIYLFSIDDTALYLVDGTDVEPPPGMEYRDYNLFREYHPHWLAFAGATAGHLALWYGKNRFCGKCGYPLRPKADERAMECESCGFVAYPAIAPAVVVAVTDGDRLLMTRYANRPFSKLALVAGFLEAGETLEDTVHREVREEVGLGVKNLRYYKSQPWAFSGSLLVGFFAELDGSPEITLDTTELAEALWVDRADIPPAEAHLALTSEMVEMFRLGTQP